MDKSLRHGATRSTLGRGRGGREAVQARAVRRGSRTRRFPRRLHALRRRAEGVPRVAVRHARGEDFGGSHPGRVRRRAGCRDEGRDCRERRRVAHSVRRGTDGVPRAAQNASQAAGDGVGVWPSMMINLFMRAAYFAYCV